MLDLISTKEACRLLRVDPRTLRKYETPDGRWCTLLGLRFRVYRYGSGPHGQRRYDRGEIIRVLAKMQRLTSTD